MAQNWYYTLDGKTKIGPVPFTLLQQLVVTGTLQPTQMVLQEGGDNRWVQAKSVPGLFPAATVKTPAAMPVEPPTQKPPGQTIQAKASALWAMFLALPKNTRYAVVGGGGAGIVLMTCLCCGVLGLIGGGGGGNKGSGTGGDNHDSNKPGDTKGHADGDSIKVQSTVMIRDYKENQAAANAKYKDKTVEVSGTIKRITGHFVELEGWGRFETLTVDCHFDKQTLAQFAKGRQITARGTCDGKTPFGINIRNCTLIWKN